MRIIVVGGGITGTRIAKLLRNEKCHVEIWEKEGNLGGRMRELFDTDAGAQYLTVPENSTTAQQDFVRTMTERGVIKEFNSNLIENNPFFTDGQKDYISPKGLQDICDSLAEGTTVSNRTLKKVSIDSTDRIQIQSEGNISESCDALVVTVPVTDLRDIDFGDMKPPPSLTAVSYSERWIAVVHCSQEGLGNGFVSRYYKEGVIRYSCLESRKRSTDSKSERILLHTTVPFSLATTDPVVAKDAILKDFVIKFPSVTPTSFHLHRWNPSQVYKPFVDTNKVPFAVISDSPLVLLTGDAFAPSTNMIGCVEAAYQVSEFVKSRL
eukprot:TRINITY_DN21622_c0_g1_i1.p1 TRINITY_DN21622_c0_g1~~TRINITY_DN21622_c0_g1_i1.p1  ORF type:complete len:323 (+),score=52.98 TRINITY_DN21622_c0_g1_i1:67-1035(+)